MFGGGELAVMKGPLVVGLDRWGDGERRQQAGFPRAEAELRALEKRLGAGAIVACLLA
jgi:hypothetical protein